MPVATLLFAVFFAVLLCCVGTMMLRIHHHETVAMGNRTIIPSYYTIIPPTPHPLYSVPCGREQTQQSRYHVPRILHAQPNPPRQHVWYRTYTCVSSNTSSAVRIPVYHLLTYPYLFSLAPRKLPSLAAGSPSPSRALQLDISVQPPDLQTRDFSSSPR